MAAIYEQLAGKSKGGAALASARLRYEVLGVLHKALDACGLSQSDVARRLKRRRSAVNQVFRGDGNVRISTLAEYLYSMGYEIDIQLVRAGEPRQAQIEDRHPEPAFPVRNTNAEVVATRLEIWTAKQVSSEWEPLSGVLVLEDVFVESGLASDDYFSLNRGPWISADVSVSAGYVSAGYEDTSTAVRVSRVAP